VTAAVRSRLRLRDQVDDAVASTMARPWRAAATSGAVALGVAAALATLLLGATGRQQVSAEFDALRATQVVVAPASESADPADDPLTGPIPIDLGDRLARVPGVVAAGIVTDLAEDLEVAARPLQDPSGRGRTRTRVIGATTGALAAAGVEVDGRVWSGTVEASGARVALVGRAVAERLGLSGPLGGEAVFVDGIPFGHLGIITSAALEPSLLDAVVVPLAAARSLWPAASRAETQGIVRVAPGAAASVAAAAPLALRPDAPDQLVATGPPDPATLRRRVEGQVQVLFLAAAGVALVVGALGIANTTMVSVLERRSELALRRALGARPSHLARHVLTETAAIGVVSGAVGAVLALGIVAAVCWQQRWVPIVDPRLVLTAPLAGGAVGVVAGWLPARRAAKTDPATAIRG
jgi:putative ABC transport system permease protein